MTVITVDRSKCKSANNISEFHRSDAMLHTSKCLDDKVVEYAECVDMSKSFKFLCFTQASVDTNLSSVLDYSCMQLVFAAR